jgi:hypothetical protein
MVAMDRQAGMPMPAGDEALTALARVSAPAVEMDFEKKNSTTNEL